MSGPARAARDGQAQMTSADNDNEDPDPTALTHIGVEGEARMVDVGGKAATGRVAVAEGRVRMAAATLATILAGDAKKGDVIGAARIAGIMAAKKTSELIPLCHPVALSKVAVDIAPDDGAARPRGARRGALRRADRRRDGGADRGRRGLPHDLRHGQGDRPRHERRGRAADREARRQVGRMAGGGAKSMSALISVEEALARVLGSAEAPLVEERVALEDAFGRVLARDVAALRTQPPFVNSAMDGYALRAADTASPPVSLRVIGEAAAGRAFDGEIGAGEAVRIFTGAPAPRGADAVVVQEDVQREGDRISVSASARVGDNLRPAGLDFAEGELLLPAGRRLTPRDVALAAAANHVALPVRRPARVAILATGDELITPGGTLGPSQIVASNNFTVAGIVEACGGIPIDLGIARDDMSALDAAIREALDAEVDVFVTLGGASVGDHDLVQKALVAAGMELGFWKIAMRPGKPLMHGRLGDLIVLGLPGNPTSSTVCAILFLQAAAHGPARRARPGRRPDPARSPRPRHEGQRPAPGLCALARSRATPTAS